MPALPSTNRKRRVYKQTFEVKNRGRTIYRHTLLVNPQEMSVTEPARVNPQQTLGGAYVANFGQGLHQITLSGVTGYNARYNADGELKDGYVEIQDFRNRLYRDFITGTSSQLEMFWYNWEDGEYFKVIPTSFRLMRNKSEPTMYRYELAMTALEPVGAGRKPRLSKNALDQLNLIALGSSVGSSISGASEVMYALRGGRG